MSLLDDFKLRKEVCRNIARFWLILKGSIGGERGEAKYYLL